MYSTGKFAILYTGASPGLELTTYETCAPCNTCKVFIKESKQIPKKIWGFFSSVFLIILMQERNMSSEN